MLVAVKLPTVTEGKVDDPPLEAGVAIWKEDWVPDCTVMPSVGTACASLAMKKGAVRTNAEVKRS